MPSVVIDLKQTDDIRDVVHRAVESLAAGKIVAIPTETVYGIAASALHSEAVQRLSDIKGRQANKPFAFAIKSVDDALDYVPGISPLARRLARRCWPGPITLVLDDEHPDSVIRRLPESVRKCVVPNGTVGLRVPAHEIALQILRLSAGPLVLTSANLSGHGDLSEADQVVNAIGEKIDLVLDDGRCKFGQPSSVVRITGNQYKFLREGVIDEKTLRRMSGFIALIVCTGNTCRSPMGEAILKKRLADRLRCKVDELEEKGVAVLSAGIAAVPGGSPSPQAMQVMDRMGLDIGGHSSQPVTARLAQFADLILTMTEGHRNALVAQWPTLGGRTHLIRHDGVDVSDPIGMSEEVYRRCAEQLDQNLTAWAAKIDLSIINDLEKAKE